MSKDTSSHYLPIIGMEVHAELKTNSKMFCGCKNDPFHAPKPNIYTCPVCLGMPGGLPVANKKAVEWTLKIGLAANCDINLFSKFDRKNYFYPDLAKGYQISQYDLPFCVNGQIETDKGVVRIHRIHLEEDTGKLQHRTLNGKKVSLVDFNRCGVPLVEIVTEPDIHSADHAKAYAKTLRQMLRFLGVSDCDMEQGSMRLEANISLLRIPDEKKINLATLSSTEAQQLIDELGLPNYKVEVKNINSFNFLAKAIEYEIKRHSELLNKGEVPVQETRGWNESKGQTISQRSKEDAEDYRYFPDPDLPPLQFTKAYIEELKSSLPKLPHNYRNHWQAEYGIESRFSAILTESPELAVQAETVFAEAKKQQVDANKVANAWVNKKISVKANTQPAEVIEQFSQLTAVTSVDESELTNVVKQVLTANQSAVESYRAGKVQVIGFLIGQVMKSLGKKVDPQQVKTAVEKQLQ